MNSSRIIHRTLAVSFTTICLQAVMFGNAGRLLTICELTEKSEFIIIGTVDSVTSQYSSDSTTIYTDVILSPTIYLKGTPVSNNLSVKVFGGMVGHMLLYVPSSADFELGESALVFLGSDPSTLNAAYRVVGWAQGKFTIYYDNQTSQNLVTRDLEGFDFISGKESGTPELLDDLKTQITKCLP